MAKTMTEMTERRVMRPSIGPFRFQKSPYPND